MPTSNAARPMITVVCPCCGEQYEAEPQAGHALLCGDATSSSDVAQLMAAGGGERADAMWTDPPYGVSYVGKTKRALTIQNDGAGDLEGLLTDAFAAADSEALADGAALYVAGPSGPQGIVFINVFNAQWRLRQMLAWVKDSMVMGHSDYHYRHELILYAFKPGEGRLGRGGAGWYGPNNATSVFEIPRPKRSEEHPTMKPVALVAAMLENSSAAGDVVYEPFCGSGTTLIASERLDRRCRALELDPRYCDVILRRWETETERTAVRANLLHDRNDRNEPAPQPDRGPVEALVE